MTRLTYWIDVVGISLRELASVLEISPAYLHRCLYDYAPTPTEVRPVVEDPLFDPLPESMREDFAYPEAYRQSASRLKRLEIEKHKVNIRIEKLKKEQALFKDRYVRDRAIVAHCNRFEPGLSQRTDVLGKWWIFKKGKAEYNLNHADFEALEAIELELEVLLFKRQRIEQGLSEFAEPVAWGILGGE
jgi:hypothetical protein